MVIMCQDRQPMNPINGTGRFVIDDSTNWATIEIGKDRRVVGQSQRITN